MMGVVVVLDTQGSFKLDELSDDKIRKITYQAINRSARWARTRMDREIRKQVNFPASYLRPSQERLNVVTQASKDNLEAVITGRDRPTSLARFIVGGPGAARKRLDGQRSRKRPVQAINVAVKPGVVKPFKGAFVVKLRGGEGGNMGLAIRMRDGTKPSAAYAPKPLKSFGPNVWLLYGPSVDQILWSVRTNGGVFAQVEDDVIEKVHEEIERLAAVENNRA